MIGQKRQTRRRDGIHYTTAGTVLYRVFVWWKFVQWFGVVGSILEQATEFTQARAAAPLKAAGIAGSADIAAGDRVPAIERPQHEAQVFLPPPQLIVPRGSRKEPVSGRALLAGSQAALSRGEKDARARAFHRCGQGWEFPGRRISSDVCKRVAPTGRGSGIQSADKLCSGGTG